jgi:hypothetical protein
MRLADFVKLGFAEELVCSFLPENDKSILQVLVRYKHNYYSFLRYLTILGKNESALRVYRHVELSKTSLLYALIAFEKYVKTGCSGLWFRGLADKSVGIPYRSMFKLIAKWKRFNIDDGEYFIIRPPRVPNLVEERVVTGYCSTCQESYVKNVVPEGEGAYKKSDKEWCLFVVSNKKKKEWKYAEDGLLDERRFSLTVVLPNGMRKFLAVSSDDCDIDKFVSLDVDVYSVLMNGEMLRASMTHILEKHHMRYELKLRELGF